MTFQYEKVDGVMAVAGIVTMVACDADAFRLLGFALFAIAAIPRGWRES